MLTVYHMSEGKVWNLIVSSQCPAQRMRALIRKLITKTFHKAFLQLGEGNVYKQITQVYLDG